MTKILEYRRVKPDPITGHTIRYRVYCLDNNPDIDAGYFAGLNELFEYCKQNDVAEWFDMTYRMTFVSW